MRIYSPINPEKESYRLPVDFFARRTHFVDHIAPIWKHIHNKGNFYVPRYILEYTRSLGIDAVPIDPDCRGTIHVKLVGRSPVLTCAYNDMEVAYRGNSRRPLMLMEHGAGIRFDHPGYAGGIGLRKKVHLFLAPNQYLKEITSSKFPEAPQTIIGTPKLDNVKRVDSINQENPTLVISFHWDGGKVAPEAGNAFPHYESVLPDLAKRYNIVGHGHPKIIEKLAPIYQKYGITSTIRSFDEVLEIADIYINDASSTMFEFCTTGKPVIVLNAPWFRRGVNHGLRFWQHSNVGINVNEPAELIPAIDATIKSPLSHYNEREAAVRELYPYLGHSSERAAAAIEKFLEDRYNGHAFDTLW